MFIFGRIVADITISEDLVEQGEQRYPTWNVLNVHKMQNESTW
jgi:hypothetical protein